MYTTRLLLLTALMILAPGALAAFVDIKPFQICDDGGANCATNGFFEAETDKIWSQAGIDINFLATTQINNSDWLDVDVDSNPADNVLDAEVLAVMQAGKAINDSAVTLAINMFFVDTLDASAGFYGLGCGAPLFAGFCQNEIGIFIAGGIYSFAGGAGRRDTIAHEIGHVLGLTHGGFGAGGADNLMTSGGSRTAPTTINDITPDGAGLSKLTDAQITEALSSGFVQVPAPGALVLLLTGLLAAGYRRIPA